MKIHLQTKRGLNTLKFGAYSEILTLILRGNWKSGYNVSIILLLVLQKNVHSRFQNNSGGVFCSCSF